MRLIKENITFIIVVEFVLNFWTFNLLTEMIIVPVSVVMGVLFAFSSMERKYEKVKKFGKLQQKLNYQVGENYMKRAKICLVGSMLGLLVSVVGIVACNSQVPLTDILSLNFVLDIQRIKEIVTYIFSCGVVISIVLFVISLGLKRKRHEEISNVKKYALYDLLYIVKKQNRHYKSLFQLNHL